MEGRAIAQAVSRQPLTAEAQVRSRVGPCGICGGQSGTGQVSLRVLFGFPCQFHSTGGPLKLKSRKKNSSSSSSSSQGCIISPQGRGASVASATGPLKKPMEQSPSQETNKSSDSREISRILWNRKVIATFSKTGQWSLLWAR